MDPSSNLITYLRAELIRGLYFIGVISVAMINMLYESNVALSVKFQCKSLFSYHAMMDPPPTPLIARPAINPFMLGTSAHINDPAMKKNNPIKTIGFLPKMSEN